MGEYYDWVNIDKKEYISPYCFDYGSKSIESSTKYNPVLRALQELLHTNWRGDRVVWLGDEVNFSDEYQESKSSKITNKELLQIIPNNDDIDLTYKNVSCLFEYARYTVTEDVESYLENPEYSVNKYMIDIKDPYKGMFEKSIYGYVYKYVINYSKEIFYSIDDVIILYQNKDEWDDIDPLPRLMAYGRDLKIGEWLGDIVGVSNDMPKNYKQIKEFIFDY